MSEDTTNDAPVTVEQCDREAAAPFMAGSFAASVRAGVCDRDPFVQAFARHRLAALASAPAGDNDLPDRLPGHWDGSDGAEIARACTRLDRSVLCKGGLSDMALANAVYLAGRDDLDLIVWQTAAKERIRWLSAQLAAALTRPRAAVGEQSREAIALIAFNAMRVANQLPEVDTIEHAPARAFYLDAADAILALQSSPAKETNNDRN